MKRCVACLTLCLIALVGCAQTVRETFELPVETLTLTDLYGNPAKVTVTLTGWSGVCERIETRQRREGHTFVLSVVGVYDGAEGSECPAIAQEYSQTVTLEPGNIEAGDYTVAAGDKKASFTLPADYQPETVEASIEAVDVVLREMSPVQAVAYITYDRGCDPAPFTDISQRREESTFFVSVRISTLPPELATCPPTTYPETEAVTLETTELASGEYLVKANGVEASFTLP